MANSQAESSLSRKEREKLRQREEILSAALLLFSERGFSNVSMQQIAEKSEFAVGSLYKFFTNKEELYQELILQTSRSICDAVWKALSEPEEELEKLRSYVRAKGELFRANAAMIRLYFSENQGGSCNVISGLAKEIQEQHQQILKYMEDIFAEGIKKGLFLQIAKPFELALALNSLTTAFAFQWLNTPDIYHYPENPNVILNILFKALLST